MPHHRTFPRIPHLPVSILGLGCMRLPVAPRHEGGHIDEERATELVRGAIDRGINYVDTAWPYHDGQSEPFVGRALQGGYRDRVLLATKLPVWLVKGEGDWERYLDHQLARLQVDHLDFYLLHALCAEYWDTVGRLGGLRALERARSDGRIRHLGFSFHDSLGTFKRIVDGYDWEFCQIQLNLLDTGYQAGLEGLRYAADRGVGVIVMEPLRGGNLVRHIPPDVQALWHRMGRTPADAALRWVWDQPGVVTALSGMGDMAQLEANLASASGGPPLQSADLALLDQVARAYRTRTRIGCTTCGYCQPCPQGVAIPETFQIWNGSAMFDDRASFSFLYDRLVVAADGGADRCVECGECEARCPQSLPIMSSLKVAHRHLTGQDRA